MRLLVFGTFDTGTHPRVGVIADGLRERGHEVVVCNVPLGLPTRMRVAILKRPWLLGVLAWRLGKAWTRLWIQSRRVGPVDAVVVGYMGQFDIHLARLRWPRTTLVLDYLVSGAGTARDRRVGGGMRLALLERIDRAALARADVVVVDTQEHLAGLPERFRPRGEVVPVGAPTSWFDPLEGDHTATGPGEPLRVVFFGLYTPLQGAPTIGEAIRLLAEQDAPVRFTMVGGGQDLEETRRLAGTSAEVAWHDWVPAPELPALVAGHDVCLGIFGTSPKARRVVPNKVYQGAAAGCAVVTSDSAPQRRAFGDAAMFVKPGSAKELATALADLASDRELLASARHRARQHAEQHFRPAAVVAGLDDRLRRSTALGDAGR